MVAIQIVARRCQLAGPEGLNFSKQKGEWIQRCGRLATLAVPRARVREHARSLEEAEPTSTKAKREVEQPASNPASYELRLTVSVQIDEQWRSQWRQWCADR